MQKYGQYCPIARAAEILGDRWTLLIVRELLRDVRHFNDMVRGLPGISRSLLSKRLRRLERAGVLEKHESEQGRKTEYRLTRAGEELETVLVALLRWGARWAFGEPDPDELDPILLLWWIRNGVRQDDLPQERIVIRFDFNDPDTDKYWMVLTPHDVSVCLVHPGFEIDLLVTTDLSTFFQVWSGRITFADALAETRIEVDGIPSLVRAFPDLFTLSPVAEIVRTELTGQPH